MRSDYRLISNKTWKILVVDDEPDVIAVTKLVLGDYEFDGRELEFLFADSAGEAIDVLSQTQDIAVILLDVVMERDDAGLDVVRYLRDDMDNYLTRIIIRTGQPGEFPESEIVENYEINDYKIKSELTEEHLRNAITVALRSYCDIMTIEYYRNNLQALVDEKTAQLQGLNDALAQRVEVETQKRMEKERMLVQQSKMATVGEMLSIIAHQWSQPLSIMSMLASELRIQELTESNAIRSSESLKQQITYMSKTLRDFSQFFKPSKTRAVFDIVSAINDTVALLSYALKQNSISVELEFDENDSFELYGYKNEFEQVALNVIKNSIDAIVEKQSSIDPFERIEQVIRIKLSQDDRHTKISFIDEAGGIPSEILEKVFDIYFTTKSEDKGTGIGLYMVKMIIKDSFGGTVSAHNNGNGTAIEISFDR